MSSYAPRITQQTVKSLVSTINDTKVVFSAAVVGGFPRTALLDDDGFYYCEVRCGNSIKSFFFICNSGYSTPYGEHLDKGGSKPVYYNATVNSKRITLYEVNSEDSNALPEGTYIHKITKFGEK